MKVPKIPSDDSIDDIDFASAGKEEKDFDGYYKKTRVEEF